MLSGMMMDRPLNISTILDYAAEVHGEREIVSAGLDKGRRRQTYSQTRERVLRLAASLFELGIRAGDRVATLAWNSHRHLELYYAISGIGAVCHTINPRLFPEQIAWIVNHADDCALFFDADLAGLAANLVSRCPAGIRLISLTEASDIPGNAPRGTIAFENLVAKGGGGFIWPELPENTASGLCYTSGTTGNPKGALYSHRSTLLHAMSVIIAAPSSFGPSERILPVVPLFHVNAWGLPFSAPLAGSDLVMPGARLDGASLFALMDEESVTASWGVPTVWSGLIEEMRRQGRKPNGLHTLLIGGSAVSEQQVRILETEFGISVLHGWGMTEMSPIGSITRPRGNLSQDERIASKLPQGQRLFGVEMKVVGADGARLPHDNAAAGELAVRGNTVIRGYYNDPVASASAFDSDGWFLTGDVSRLAPDGVMTIVDRSKDMIKSGGEWISSIDLENAACACPGVRQAAAIAVPDDRWGERPLLVVVAQHDRDLSVGDVRQFLSERMARWQIPERIVFRESLPLTATGKISKLELRRMLVEHGQYGRQPQG